MDMKDLLGGKGANLAEMTSVLGLPVPGGFTITTDAEVSADTLRRLCERYKDVVRRETGKAFPQDPMVQLKGAIEAVFRSWNGARAIAYRVRERISHDLGTAVNVQSMVFGNRDDNSGTGVGFTRMRLPARTSPTATSCSMRKVRTSSPASATPKTSTR